MLEVICNSVQCYVYNHLNARVVAYHHDINNEDVARLISVAQRPDSISYDPNIKYDIFTFDNKDGAFPMMSRDFAYTNVLYKDKIVRSFIGGDFFQVVDHVERATKLKEDLEKYGIKLF